MGVGIEMWEIHVWTMDDELGDAYDQSDCRTVNEVNKRLFTSVYAYL